MQGCKPHGQVAACATGSDGEPAGNDAHTAASEPGAAAGSSSLIPVEVIVPYCPLQFGEQLSLVGSCAELGAWDASAAPLLQWQEGDNWAATLSLPPGEHTCKLVLVRQDGSLHWEEGEDRAISIPANASSAALAMRFGITAATEVRTVPRTATAGAEPVGQLRVAPGPSTVTEAPPPAAAAPAPPTAEPWAPAEQLEHAVMEGALGGEPAVAAEAYSPEAYPAEAYLPEAGLVEPAVEPASAAQVQQLAQAKLELSARILALQEEVQQRWGPLGCPLGRLCQHAHRRACCVCVCVWWWVCGCEMRVGRGGFPAASAPGQTERCLPACPCGHRAMRTGCAWNASATPALGTP